MRLAASGQLTAAQIAEQVGISRRQFFHWVNALKAGGIEGLLKRAHGGGVAPQVGGKVLTELQAGLKEGRWKRAKEIQHWLQQRHRKKLTIKGVYYWLGKLGGVLKVPRKAHAQKDAAQAAEFQRKLCDRLKNLNVTGGKPVRIWVAAVQQRQDGIRAGRCRPSEYFGATSFHALLSKAFQSFHVPRHLFASQCLRPKMSKVSPLTPRSSVMGLIRV
jgi:transposase